MKTFCYSILIATFLLMPISIAESAEHTFGVGFHYFYALDDISEDLQESLDDAFHRDGFAINGFYRFKPNTHFGLQFELQTFPDGFFDTENTISPRFFALFGQSVYLGAGIAWNYVSWENETENFHDFDRWSDPYYILRAGIEFPFVVDDLKIHINANYEFNEWNDIDEFDSDAITLGAGLSITI